MLLALLSSALLFTQQTLPGMPPVIDSRNVYSETTAGKLSSATMGALPRVYVPNVKSGDVYVIDPATFQVVDQFVVGGNPQHVIPSWDLKTLWIAGSAERNSRAFIPNRSENWKARHDDQGSRCIQPVLHSGWPFSNRRCRSLEAAGIPRPANDEAAVHDCHVAVLRRQSRRLLCRRPLRVFHM